MTLQPFASLKLPRHLAMDFMDAFMRAENALKQGGFATMANGAACAHWDKFASSIKAGFDAIDNQSFRDSVIYLVQNPPRKQVIKESGLEWEDSPVPTGSAAHQSLLMVRRVRNNLFHGGKTFVLGGGDTFERNTNLVTASGKVLDHAIRLNHIVHSYHSRGYSNI